MNAIYEASLKDLSLRSYWYHTEDQLMFQFLFCGINKTFMDLKINYKSDTPFFDVSTEYGDHYNNCQRVNRYKKWWKFGIYSFNLKLFFTLWRKILFIPIPGTEMKNTEYVRFVLSQSYTITNIGSAKLQRALQKFKKCVGTCYLEYYKVKR